MYKIIYKQNNYLLKKEIHIYVNSGLIFEKKLSLKKAHIKIEI